MVHQLTGAFFTMGLVQLSLDIQEAGVKHLHIQDRSFYDFKDFPKGTLQIKPPGFDWVDLHECLYFNKYYTTKQLGLQCDECQDELLNLPDGVWKVNWMLGEELSTAVEYYHLRNSLQVACYNRIVSYILSLAPRMTRRDLDERLSRLLTIKQYIDSARWMVEENGDITRGLALYKESEEMLKPYKNECGC